MDSSLRELFGRAGQIQARDRVPSGSPAAFILRNGKNELKVVDGVLALTRRGLTMLRAKRAMERMLERGMAYVALPTVESEDEVIAELSSAGIAAVGAKGPRLIDVRQLRERLNLSREEFAARYGLEVETVRNWEAGRREPDRTARSYLQAIDNEPAAVEEAYAASSRG